jgi:aerobic carbon-monoxide dehydrogenase medium subunit
MNAFRYQRPLDIAEAVSGLLANSEAKLIAGGQTLLPSLKLRLASPSLLIDLAAIPSLRGIVESPGTITVRAMTRHAEVASSSVIAQKIHGLASLAGGVGDRMVRNMGTIGGSIANSDPAADYPAALLALDAVVITTTRRIPATDFFLGMFETALQPGEIVTAVEFAVPTASSYVKFRQPASRFAMVGVFVARYPSCVRVAVAGAGSLAFRLPHFEAALASRFSEDAVLGLPVETDALSTDLHATSEYRASLIPIIAGRAVSAIIKQHGLRIS